MVNVLTVLLDDHKNPKRIEQIQEFLKTYEAVLYGDIYVPEYQMEQRANEMRKRAERQKEQADKARLMAKVEGFSK